MTINEYLSDKSYPGRGIIAGVNKSGDKIFLAYFIMGRSENSRNRIFQKTADGIETKALDESKVSDPSLIIYKPVKHFDNKIIITNGDQTDTVFNYIANGKTFEEALNTRTFEPDKPNFTPRISFVTELRNTTPLLKFSLIKASHSEQPIRIFYNYFAENGTAYILHTYSENINPLPPFAGEPKLVDISENFGNFTNEIWESLNFENKISLFTECIDINTKKIQSTIKNKYIKEK